MEINNKSREENEMNTEIFVVTKKGENKYFNEVFNFTGTIQECDDFALLNNFGGGVEEYEECDGVCKGDSSVTDCYGDCGETYPKEEVDLDEGVCKNCDQLTPRSDLREYKRDIYFCGGCYEDFTMTDEEYESKSITTERNIR